MVCIRSFTQRDGFFIFDPEKEEDSTHFQRGHLHGHIAIEQRHFWFTRRREKICKNIESHLPRSARILDVGGGTGFVASLLKQKGFAIEMGDIHSLGFPFARQRGVERFYQFDLFDPPFEEEFDAICLFDVVEHFSEPLKAIECIKKMLKPGGWIFLTVPAHQWLWSREDRIARHDQRYTKAQLRELISLSGLKLIEARYFFSTLVPLLLLRKWLRRDDGTPLKPGELFQPKIFPLINGFLSYLTKLEFALDRFVPNWMGGSLIAVAQKDEKMPSPFR